MTVENLELRTCDKHLLQDGRHETAEIVIWKKPESCFTLARWVKDKEGFNLYFVGDRPFVFGNSETFWRLAKFGQGYLEEWFGTEES